MSCKKCKEIILREDYPCIVRNHRGEGKFGCEAQIGRTFGNVVEVNFNTCKYCLFRESINTYRKELDKAVPKPEWCRFAETCLKGKYCYSLPMKCMYDVRPERKNNDKENNNRD